MVKNLTAIAVASMRAYRWAPASVAVDVVADVAAIADVAGGIAVVAEDTTVVDAKGCCSCCLRNLPTVSK